MGIEISRGRAKKRKFQKAAEEQKWSWRNGPVIITYKPIEPLKVRRVERTIKRSAK